MEDAWLRQRFRRLRTLMLVVGVLACCHSGGAHAQRALSGTVLDAETNNPIVLVTITLDKRVMRLSGSDGTFDFGAVASGHHELTFDHIAYKRRVLQLEWPPAPGPLVVKLEPSPFQSGEIVVKGKRIERSLPVSAIVIDRDALAILPGNIANDPLRTLQAQPSASADGIDFLSRMAVRGGDSEENAVYFDGHRLKHYAHVGGFAGVAYDDMLGSTVLFPGAAPIQYKGGLSGVVLMKPADPDTSFRSFRYDITSMAGGVVEQVAPTLSLQASAKSNFFNLPAYQEVGVKRRAFKDFLGRAIYKRGSATLNATLLGAKDTETASDLVGFTRIENPPERSKSSLLAGANLTYHAPAWDFHIRPSYSRFDSHDEISRPVDVWEHELRDARVFAEVARRGSFYGFAVSGEVGNIRHFGDGGELHDTPYSASTEIRLMRSEATALVLGIGGAREPWTSRFEPEAYGSMQVDLWGRGSVNAGYRRSHQSPFLFSERRFFASLPIDPGELIRRYAPTWTDARAVEMDQVSVGATIALPFDASFSYDGFHRTYENLLTWDWSGFPDVTDVKNDGDGHGFGYEMVLSRPGPGPISAMVALSRARIWKKEGSLAAEKIGDFDRPGSFQVGISARLSDRTQLSMRWMETDGRPYTPYDRQVGAPSEALINSVRLPQYQRLDVKLLHRIPYKTFSAEIFLDLINALNEDNISTMYAVENGSGQYVTRPYGGTKFFPIVGATVRW